MWCRDKIFTFHRKLNQGIGLMRNTRHLKIYRMLVAIVRLNGVVSSLVKIVRFGISLVNSILARILLFVQVSAICYVCSMNARFFNLLR